MLLIDAQMRSKDLKAALSVAQDGVATLPDSPDMHDALGRVQLASGDFNQAIASFKKTADLQPRSVAAHLRLAELYAKTKNTDAARQSLKRALAITPDLVTAQRDLIMLELGAGHADEALALAHQVQKAPGHEAAGLMLVGDVEAAQKRWDAAAAAYRSGLKQSNASEFAIKLHVVMQSSHQEAGAERFAASWLKDHPKDAVFLSHLGNTALSQGKFAAAESHYVAVVGLQPDNPVALNNLAWVTQRLNKPGALAYAEKATALQPNQPAFMDTLAMILGNKGELNKALEIEKKAVALQPDQPGVRLNLAKLYIKAGQGAETLFFDWVNRCMARNQRARPSLVDSKTVPLMTLHWWRQAEHCQYSRPSRRNELVMPQLHAGQANPAGQRAAISAASHCSSVPYLSLNSAIESPR